MQVKPVRRTTGVLLENIHMAYKKQLAILCQMAIEDEEIDASWSLNPDEMRWEREEPLIEPRRARSTKSR